MLAVVISAVLIAWLRRLGTGERVRALAIALVLGGALGNLIDRLSTGAVVDFLQFYFWGWPYPAFNIADSAITVGVVLLLFMEWRRPVSGRDAEVRQREQDRPTQH